MTVHAQLYQTIILMWSLLVAPSVAMLTEASTDQNQTASISQLRAEYATHFLVAAPHMALAKYSAIKVIASRLSTSWRLPGALASKRMSSIKHLHWCLEGQNRQTIARQPKWLS